MNPIALDAPDLEARLATAERRRLRAALGELRLLAARTESFHEAAHTLRELLGTDRAAIYTRQDNGELGTIGHTFSGSGWLDRVRQSVPKSAVYRLRGTDDFGNAAVCDTTLYRNSGHEELARRDEAFRAFGYARQLRAALYQRERFHLYMGGFNVDGDNHFTVAQGIMLAVAARTYGRSRRLAQRFTANKAGNLAAVFDSVDQPVVVLDSKGRVVHINRAAAISEAHRETWVQALARAPDSDTLRRRGDLIHLNGYDVVIARNAIANTATLPDSLRTVASLAIVGKSDKEIAAQLGRPIATVRTYMQRIYTRLGVHSRVELAKKFR